MRDYIDTCQLLVVTMGAPCAAFVNWARFDRHRHPDTWSESRTVDETHAAVGATIVMKQFVANMQFAIANPACSAIFNLESFV